MAKAIYNNAYDGITTWTSVLSQQSTVTADFSSGKVSVTMSGFSKVTNSNGSSLSPIDEIKVTDMIINENGFSGGAFKTYKAGKEVNFTGGSTNSSQGSFYGLKSDNSAPAEVGGLVLMHGISGIVSGTYLAK